MAVSLTDFVQGCIMFVALVLVPVVALSHIGGLGGMTETVRGIAFTGTAFPIIYAGRAANFADLNAGAGEAEAVAAEPEAEGACGYEVRFNKLGDVVHTKPGQTILAAAQQQGLRVPSSCSKGLCGTCKTKMLEGKVDMKHGGGIRQREIDQGWILPCCSVPLSPVVLDR